MKRIAALLAMTFVALAAHAGGVAKDTPVRVEGSGIEPGWFEGKIFISGEGCTMVKLAKPTKDKYTMLALIAIAKIQKKDGGGWRDLSLKDLKAKEPVRCLVEGSD
jgi:hypothetical protein